MMPTKRQGCQRGISKQLCFSLPTCTTVQLCTSIDSLTWNISLSSWVWMPAVVCLGLLKAQELEWACQTENLSGAFQLVNKRGMPEETSLLGLQLWKFGLLNHVLANPPAAAVLVRALLHCFLPAELKALLWKTLYEYVGECPWHEELTVWGVIGHAADGGRADRQTDTHTHTHRLASELGDFKCKERHCYKNRVWVCSSYFCRARAIARGTCSIKETWLEHKAIESRAGYRKISPLINPQAITANCHAVWSGREREYIPQPLWKGKSIKSYLFKTVLGWRGVLFCWVFLASSESVL